MNTKIYTIHDSAVGAFLPPFFARSNGEAIRSFQDACNDPKSQFHSHRSDYMLVCIGEYDDATASITSQPPEKLMAGSDVF